ncbi:MAG: hypothetical protein AAGB31_15305, partial [Bdellovibrio sp.]
MNKVLLLSCCFFVGCGASSGSHWQEKTKPSPPSVVIKEAEISEIKYIPKGEVPRAYLLSIYDEVIDIYLAGKKFYEYRKSFPRDPVTHIVFFNTKTQSLIGYAKIVETLMGPTDDVITKTVHRSGVSAKALKGYYGDKKIAFATEVEGFVSLS